MSLWNTLRTIFYFTLIMVRTPIILLRFIVKRRSAVYRFKKELITSGIPRQEADELASNYPLKLGDLVNLAQGRSKKKGSVSIPA